MFRQCNDLITNTRFDIRVNTTNSDTEPSVSGVQSTHANYSILMLFCSSDRSTTVLTNSRVGGGGHRQQVSREVSFSLEKKGLVREPSFIYDTSVEAFGSAGANIDDLDCSEYNLEEEEDRLEGQDDAASISIIGRIAREIYIEPVDPFQVGADSLHLGGDFDFNDDYTEVSSGEKPGSVHVSFDGDDFRDPNLRIPLSGRRQAENFFLTDPRPRQPVNPGDGAMDIEVPEVERKRLSVEGGSKISSTPEGESYFMARENSFVRKVHDGELQNLAVEISDYFSLESVDEELVVKPIVEDPGAEIEITDLRPESSLVVKPIDLTVKRAPVSSFETIYDKVSLEEVKPRSRITKEEIMAGLGERFQGTVEVPDFVSSVDELYQFSSMDMAQSSSSTSHLETAVRQPVRRWTAPAGTVEAPILAAEEFTVRFEPVLERTEGHWEELERMMSEQSCREQG